MCPAILKRKEKQKQKNPHFNLEFSKVILPWNPFALSIHQSEGGLVFLGTPSGNHWPSSPGPTSSWAGPTCLSSFSSSPCVNLLLQPHLDAHISSDEPGCSCLCLCTSCSLPEPAMLFPSFPPSMCLKDWPKRLLFCTWFPKASNQS